MAVKKKAERFEKGEKRCRRDLNTGVRPQFSQGSRGIVMLDNETWKKCGGKPEGAAQGAGYYPAIPPWNKAGKGETETVDHSMH